VLDEVGVTPAGDASSTDANIPISRGIPAICIGLTSGGGVHREDEFIDIAPVELGLAQLLILTVCAAEELHSGSLQL
jgi:tripeptide aminopeptidase